MTEQHKAKANCLAAISAFQNKSEDAIPLSFFFGLCQKSGVKSQNKHDNFLCCVNLMTHASSYPVIQLMGQSEPFLASIRWKAGYTLGPSQV